MRFEVEVVDGTGGELRNLHKAREAWNQAHPDKQAPDAPSFVQALMDEAVTEVLEKI